MFPDGACRICGKFDWQLKPQANQRTARGVHEKAHINRGEAKFIIIDAASGMKMILKTALGRQMFPDAPATPNTVSNTDSIPRLQEGTAAAKVRSLLPSMPAEFTIKDVITKAGDISVASVSAALRWAKDGGVIKVVRRYDMGEWRSIGKSGMPPLVYSFIGFDNYTPPVKTSHVSKSKMVTQSIAISGLDTAALTSVLEDAEPEHQCIATDAISTLQRSLATLNLLLAVQDMPPAQLIALSGTINAISQTTRLRR